MVSALSKLISARMMNEVEQTEDHITEDSEYLSYISSAVGVSEDALRDVAGVIYDSSPTAFVFGNDGLVERQSEALADTIVNLSLITESINKETGGIFPLYYGANTMGARCLGCGPDLLPGGFLDDVVISERIANLWRSSLPSMEGLNMYATIQSIMKGRIKAVILMSDGISAENGLLEGFKDALPNLEFLAVSAVFDDALTEHADVVIPATVYAEQNGTVTNLEGRVQRLRPLWAPKHDEKNGWEVFSGIAGALNVEGFAYKSYEDVKAEMVLAAPAYSDATLRFARTDIVKEEGGKISDSLEIHPIETLQPPQNGSSVIFTPGRVLHQNERAVHIENRDNMNYVNRQELISIHKQDAAAAGIAENDVVVVKYRGRVLMRGLTRLDAVHRGTVSTTTLFAQLASSMQESSNPDPAPNVEPLLIRHVNVIKENEDARRK